MERAHIKYQPTSPNDPNDDESDEEISDNINEATAMMDGNEIEDIGYVDEEDQGVTTNGQEDPEEPPAAELSEEVAGDADEVQGSPGENGGSIEGQDTTSGANDGEAENVQEPPSIENEEGEDIDGERGAGETGAEETGADERGAEGGASSPPPNLAIEIPTGNADEDDDSPPPYGSPPTYDEAMKKSVRPSMSYIEAVGGDELEWDREERVKPTMLQDSRGKEPDRIDGVELEEVVLDSGRGDTSTMEPSVADTSFSTPSAGGGYHSAAAASFAAPDQFPGGIAEARPGYDVETPSSVPTVSFADYSRRTWMIYIVSVLVAIGALLMIILLPLTFSYVEYYQYGMKKGRISQVVEFAKEIYDLGRYPIGPGNTFKRYPAWAHMVNFERIDFFTTDRIVLAAGISFQYFIKQDELGLIEQKYDKSYEDIIKSVAEAAIKNKAATYSTDEYLSERGKIEQGLHDAVRLKLGGDCCPSRDECIRLGSCHLCSQNQDTCNKGYHLDVRFFQMKQLSVPPNLSEKYLNVQLILEGNEEAVYIQKYQVFVKETEAKSEIILNRANVINNNGTTQARLILKQGNITANAKRELAHNQGLKRLYDAIDITDEGHKASLHWLRTLGRHQRLVTGTSFKDYIAFVQGLGDDD